MKILFIISVCSHGRGGHFHSLNHISKELGKHISVGIITVGAGISPVLNDNPFFIRHVKTHRLNFIRCRQECIEIIDTFKPTILHFFDTRSYALFSIILVGKKYKYLINKCGGPNPNWYLFARNIVVFSKENYLWFKSNFKFTKSNITFIPNRVSSIVFSSVNTDIIKDKLFTFLRICRIGESYKKGIEKIFNLLIFLKNAGIQSKLIIIGTIESNDVYASLKKVIVSQNLCVDFYTDNIITKEASTYIWLADAVIGTGRSLMEAASAGLPLLTENAEDKYPVLVTNENYDQLATTNFSPRNTIAGFDSNNNLKNILKLVKDDNYRNKMSMFSKYIYHNDFSISKCYELYINLYNQIEPSRFFNISDTFYYLRVIRSMLNTYKHCKAE